MKPTDLLINMQEKAFNKALKATTSELDTLDTRINNLEHNPEETKNKQDKNDAISTVLFCLLVLAISNYGLYALHDIDLTKAKAILSPEKLMEFYHWFFNTMFILKILMPMFVIGFSIRSLSIQIDNLPFRKEKSLSEYKVKTMKTLVAYRESLISRKAELIEAIRKIQTSK
jgi:hypothetical protein